MSPQIITPGSASVPMGVVVHGLETPTGIVPESRRDRFVLAALQGILARESSTLAPGSSLGRLAVAIADAALAAMAAPSPAPASPVPATGPAEAGS